MARYGIETSIYMQQELLKAIDKVIAQDRFSFNSRSQFINGAVHSKLREMGLLPRGEEQ